MATYKQVVGVLGENLASWFSLGLKWLNWKIDFSKLLHQFHQLKKDDLVGLIAGTHKISAVQVHQKTLVKISEVVNPLEVIHPDYKPIKNGIVVKLKKRSRKAILEDTTLYVLGGNFQNKIMPLLTEGETSQEVLRTDELLKRKRDSEIKAEMQISEISADQIAERIIQLRSKIKSWTIIGYCNGFVVGAGPDGDGRLFVNAYGLDDWLDGHRLLSCDKNLGS